MYNMSFILGGGDFNTNLRRSSYFTTAFNEYINDEHLYSCTKVIVAQYSVHIIVKAQRQGH